MLKLKFQMGALSEQEQVRRDKLKSLRALGINPYPADLFPVDHSSAQIKAITLPMKKK